MIDNRLVNAYIAELEALREHGRDLAEQFPEIASRLDIGPRQSQDAHVERVVESAAFLAARLRLMLAQDAAELPLTLLGMLAPALAEPVPSMTVIRLAGGTDDELVPTGTRFDADLGSGPVCFRTAMPIAAAPLAVGTARLEAGTGHADGITVHVDRGTTPDPWLLYLGADRRSGAVLMDALDECLTRVEVVTPDGRRNRVPQDAVRVRGFDRNDAALPWRPAAHPAHRLLVEFMVLPEKFRFVSVAGVTLAAGSELRFLFDRPLSLPTPLPDGLVNVNCVPAINLWDAPGTPIEVSGRQLEYPVKVDALRYRSVECHSVQSVDLYHSDAGQPQRIDPLLAYGRINETPIRWGTRRRQTRQGGEVLLYFEGLDFAQLGRTQLLATPRVLASNRDLAPYVRTGQTLLPVTGLGSWRGVMQMTPTEYRHPVANEQALQTLIGFLHSSMSGLVAASGRGAFRTLLKGFPGADRAGWIDGVGNASIEPVTVLRRGRPEAGVSVVIPYDSYSHPTTSRAGVRRVIGRMLESQRRLNRVEEVRLDV